MKKEELKKFAQLLDDQFKEYDKLIAYWKRVADTRGLANDDLRIENANLRRSIANSHNTDKSLCDKCNQAVDVCECRPRCANCFHLTYA